jgi:hypothetical protein
MRKKDCSKRSRIAAALSGDRVDSSSMSLGIPVVRHVVPPIASDVVRVALRCGILEEVVGEECV